MVRGPRAGLDELATAEAGPALAGHHRVDAVRAHLLDLAGDQQAARTHYELAARRTLSVPEQRYLQSRAAQVTPPEARPRRKSGS
jgi:predicted RNA polymerase sigma factor